MKSNILNFHNEIVKKNNIIDIIEQKINIANTMKTNSVLANNYNDAKKISIELEKNIDTNNLLFGVPYSLKDLICTKGITTTGGSKFYENFIPPYSATVYELLQKQNCILLNKDNCDEFGLGGSGTYSGYGLVTSHLNSEYSVGGSSSGSVVNVASNAVLFSIGTDTGDSIRRPSSLVGVVGYKPTYGLISRYGCFSYASSLDHVGIITSYVTDVAIVADCIIDFDKKDFTSQKINKDFYKNLKVEKDITFGIIKGIEEYCTNEVKNIYLSSIDKIKKNHEVVEVEIDKIDLMAIEPTYMIISYGEACSNHMCDTSIQAGVYVENSKGYTNILQNARTKHYGEQLKRRFVIGSYITSFENFEKIFQRTKKVRTHLNNIYNQMLDKVDCLILPSASSFSPKISNVLNKTFSTTYADDVLEFANFAGTPSITVPVYKQGVNNFGLNLNTKQFSDNKLFNYALTIEELFNNDDK